MKPFLQNSPEMVVSKAMLNSPLELPNVPAPILTGVNTTTMTLPIRPFPSIHIAGVKPVHPKSMPQSLPVLPTVAAPTRPGLHPTPIVSPINPIPLVPPAHAVVIHAATGALPPVKLPLVNVAVSEHLHPATGPNPLLRFRPRPDGPEHGERRRGAGDGGGFEADRERREVKREGDVEGEEKRRGERDGGEEVKEEGARDEEVEVEKRKGKEEDGTASLEAAEDAEGGATGG